MGAVPNTVVAGMSYAAAVDVDIGTGCSLWRLDTRAYIHEYGYLRSPQKRRHLSYIKEEAVAEYRTAAISRRVGNMPSFIEGGWRKAYGRMMRLTGEHVVAR